MTEQDKLDTVADIQSIQAQLAKPTPNKSVVRTLWNGLQVIATIDGVATCFLRVAGYLAPLLA
jgi:hypothetical protein